MLSVIEGLMVAVLLRNIFFGCMLVKFEMAYSNIFNRNSLMVLVRILYGNPNSLLIHKPYTFLKTTKPCLFGYMINVLMEVLIFCTQRPDVGGVVRLPAVQCQC